MEAEFKANCRWRHAVPGAFAAFVLGCAPLPPQPGAQSTDPAMEGFSPARAYDISDCLLPGEVRTVGGRTYLTPRRPTRTTIDDCKIRGGEFQIYDRAEYASSLRIWLEQAETGDPEAQTYVGMLYERGVDGSPDYAAALDWYRKAAKKDYAHAQFQLGAMYERGLGVEKDYVEAMNWYRKAQGVSDDDLIYRSTLQKALEQQREELQRTIEDLQQSLEESDVEIRALREQIAQIDSREEGAEQRIATLQRIVERFESDRQSASSSKAQASERLARLPPPQPPVDWPEDTGPMPRSSEFGRYYALIIGVQNYSLLEDLQTPLNDVARVGELLQSKYGFEVVALSDPSDLLIKRTVYDLFDEIGENDNLLIYFTGVGHRMSLFGNREAGFWLPSNAERPPRDINWVENEFVTNHLGRIKAHRVLVVSDSAYAGLISDDPNLLLGEGYDTPVYVKHQLPKRSRLLITSGGDAPLVQSASSENSTFARAFLDVLTSNDQVLATPALYQKVHEIMRRSGEIRQTDQLPELKAIKPAGHELGDFFFVPTPGAG